MREIRLVITQGKTSVSVGEVNADRRLKFKVIVGVPGTLSMGFASLVAQPTLQSDAPVIAAAAFTIRKE